MKHSFKLLSVAAVAFFLFMVQAASAQSKNNTIPEEGFWQLVTNKAEKRTTLVQFYTDNKTLIYEEKVKGMKFNLKRKKTLLRLKQGLEKAMLAWNQKNEVIKDQQWIAGPHKR